MAGPRALAALAALPALFWACLTAAAAHAEYKTTTAQALAAHAEWLPYAPPPPGPAAAVCLVDTGVDLNPDTSSNVVARFALDGGDPGDLSPSKHGTQMAMVMGAPINGWGMVGAWPGVPIVSVRAAVAADGSFSFEGYRNGIEKCLRVGDQYGVRAIVLPLDSQPARSSEDAARRRDELGRAADRGLNVLAAAGNTGDAPSDLAADPAVTAIGAASTAGEPCSFSARGAGVDLFVPSCEIDQANPEDGGPTLGRGTSQAAALSAAITAALRSYDVGLSSLEAERVLGQSGSGLLQTDRAFDQVGLGGVVAAGQAARDAAGSRSRDTARRLPSPRIRLRFTKSKRWRATLRNRPSTALAALRKTNGRLILRRRRANVFTGRQDPSSLCIRYEAVGRSPSACVRLVRRAAVP